MMLTGSSSMFVLKNTSASFFPAGVLTSTTRKVTGVSPAWYHKQVKLRHSRVLISPPYQLTTNDCHDCVGSVNNAFSVIRFPFRGFLPNFLGKYSGNSNNWASNRRRD